MKNFRITIFVLSLLFCDLVSAQNEGIVGFSFSALNKNVMINSADKVNETAIKGRGFISLEAIYWHPLTDYLNLEVGLNYSYQNFSKIIDDTQNEKLDAHLLNIPIGLKVDFLKYGFINSGVLVDITHETGIGSYFGGGVQYLSPVGFGVFVNPYVKMHSILPVDFNFTSKKVLEMGVKFGITYQLNNPYRNRKNLFSN